MEASDAAGDERPAADEAPIGIEVSIPAAEEIPEVGTLVRMLVKVIG